MHLKDSIHIHVMGNSDFKVYLPTCIKSIVKFEENLHKNIRRNESKLKKLILFDLIDSSVLHA